MQKANNLKQYFITGTDTDVGKTFVSVLLIQSMVKNSQQDCFYCKPIQTGSKKGKNDEDTVKRICKNTLTQTILHYSFPASPLFSSVLENRELDYSSLLKRCLQLKKIHRHLIFEGAGGLFVPIHKNKYYIDFIKQLKIPVILVARAGLGTLNHTLLSIEALNSYKIPVKLIVLNVGNEKRPDMTLVNDNKSHLEMATKIPVILVPNIKPKDKTHSIFESSLF